MKSAAPGTIPAHNRRNLTENTISAFAYWRLHCVARNLDVIIYSEGGAKTV